MVLVYIFLMEWPNYCFEKNELFELFWWLALYKAQISFSMEISHLNDFFFFIICTSIISFYRIFQHFKSTWIATRVGYVSLYISKNQHCTFTAYKFYFCYFCHHHTHPKLFRAHSFRYTSFLCHFNQNDIGNLGWFPFA